MSKNLKWPAACIGVLLASTCLIVAGKPASDSENAPAPGAGPQPPPEMAALYPRIGTWKVVIRTMPSESSPTGGVDEGVMVMKKGPGGFSIVQEFSSQGSSGNLVGQSYAWWDAKAKQYKSVWCDNLQGCVDFTTAVSGNSWSVELDGEAGGRKVHTVIRATMSADRNTIHEEAASSYDGGPARTESVSEYKRVLGAVSDKR